ncbi:MAG: hypothetical protein CM15mP70_02150 [Pelagibacteraceae bacterium]|nr:MAG: hypothetical protein CM15mP70_02150 [Pelagibacteraceae bacterium]
MNLVFDLKFEKLNDLCDQVFDYFHLAYYDLESKIDNELNINSIKSKFETFADKHFKSAIKDFENEIQYLKNKSPNELIKLEKISSEIHQYFNQLVNYKIFDSEIIT